MPFGMVSGVGRGMGVLDRGGDRQRGRGNFGGESGASHCNQWVLCDAAVPKLLWAGFVVNPCGEACKLVNRHLSVETQKNVLCCTVFVSDPSLTYI